MSKVSPEEMKEALRGLECIEALNTVRKYVVGLSDRPYTIGIQLGEPDEFVNLREYLSDEGVWRVIAAIEIELHAAQRAKRVAIEMTTAVDLSGITIDPPRKEFSN